jgi:hypothetical protein
MKCGNIGIGRFVILKYIKLNTTSEFKLESLADFFKLL